MPGIPCKGETSVSPWNTAALYGGRAQCHCIRKAAKFVPQWGAFLFNILSGVWLTGGNRASFSVCYIVCGACRTLCEESCTRGWFLCRTDVLTHSLLCRTVRSKVTCVLSPVLFSPEILTLLLYVFQTQICFQWKELCPSRDVKKIVAVRVYRVSQDLRPLLQDWIPEVILRQKYRIHSGRFDSDCESVNCSVFIELRSLTL